MLRFILYKIIRKLLFPLLGNTSFGIRIKWYAGLYLVEPWYFMHFIRKKPEKVKELTDPERPLQDSLRELLALQRQDSFRILEAGAGPLSRIGKKWEGHRIEIIPLDPLARQYNRILARRGIVPPVKTIKGSIESLHRQFQKGSIDLIYARNCLDHTADPFKSLINLLEVLKQGRYIYFEHFSAVGEKNNYFGLHQWNFIIQEGELHVSDKTKRIHYNLSQELKARCSVECSQEEGKILAKIKKHIISGKDEKNPVHVFGNITG
jgi:SAM-dependent methyltransferase